MTDFSIRQPETLLKLAISGFGTWIKSQLSYLRTLQPDSPEDQISAVIERIQLQINDVPNILHDAVASEVLETLSFARAVRLIVHMEELHERNMYKRVLKTLYTQNLTSLSLYPMQIKVFESDILTKLTNLAIRASCCEQVEIINILKKGPNIKALRLVEIDYSCKKVFRYLIRNCRLIEEIDLDDIENANNQSIKLIARLPNLKSVKLINTTVSENGIKTLLTACKKLEKIEIRSDFDGSKHIINTLEEIALSNTGQLQLQLKSFNDGNFPTLRQVEIIAAICPFLHEIEIVKSNTHDYLTPINNLRLLRKLTLSRLDFCNDNLIQLLEVKGSNLVALVLNCVNININEWADVSRLCPNLESLSIVFKPLDNYDCNLETVAETLLFNKVKCLHISGSPHDDEVIFMLSNCLTVEHISIYHQTGCVDDDIMIRVLEKNPLHTLKKLLIGRSLLTKPVIERLVRNCVSLEMEETFIW